MYNLGTGKGISVMELIQTFERVNKVKIPYVIQERRAGDISSMYANATLAEKELGWKAVHSVDEMCKCAATRAVCLSYPLINLPAYYFHPPFQVKTFGDGKP